MTAAPTTPSETPTHQRVGWLELFYDLVFVVVIEQLTKLLHDDPNEGRIWLTIGLTFLVWLAWFNVSALTNLSGGVGPRGRPFIFCSMAGIGVLALGVEGMPHWHVGLFALGFTIARSAVWPLWMRSRVDAGLGWPRAIFYGPVLGVLWLCTPLIHRPKALVAAFVLLGIAEMAFSFARPEGDGRSHIHGPHMVERIGLLMMIVLGESVVQIVTALEGERTPLRWLTAALAMAVLSALWWLIYEASVSKLEAVMDRDDSSIADFIGGSQLGIVIGLILVAAGLADAIHTASPDEAHHAAAHLHHGSMTCLCLGVLMIHLGVTSLSRRAFALDLGIARPARSAMTRQERRDEVARRRAERERQKAEGRTEGKHWGEILHWVTFVAPLVLVWKFCGGAPAWLLLAILFVYIAINTWMHGLGERRIRRYVADGGQFPGSAPRTSETAEGELP